MLTKTGRITATLIIVLFLAIGLFLCAPRVHGATPIVNQANASASLSTMNLADIQAGVYNSIVAAPPQQYVYMGVYLPTSIDVTVTAVSFSVNGGSFGSYGSSEYGIGSLPTYYGANIGGVILTGTTIAGSTTNQFATYNLRLSGMTDQTVIWRIDTSAGIKTAVSDFNTVPEPSTYFLLVAGLGFVVLFQHRKSARQKMLRI